MAERKQYMDHVPFRTLVRDERVQRMLMPGGVRALSNKWNLDMVGILTVSKRADRRLYLLDGGHRHAAALNLGFDHVKVHVHVYSGLTLEEEARLFLALNDSRHVSPFDRFQVGLTAQDPVCVGLAESLDRHQLRIAASASPGAVTCVQALMRLYKGDPDALDRTCDVLIAAWGRRPSAFEKVLVEGVGEVFRKHNGAVERDVLVKKLAKYEGGPAALQGAARGLSELRRIALKAAAEQVIVDTYNRGRRSKVLYAGGASDT